MKTILSILNDCAVFILRASIHTSSIEEQKAIEVIWRGMDQEQAA